MEYLIIIPTYNERENIDNLLKKIFQIKKDIHILFVDSLSPDGTGEYIRDFSKKNKNILLITGRKKGLGEAYKKGFLYAKNKLHPKYIIQMDADLSHDPKYLKELIKESKDYDIVIGSRYVKGGSIPDDWGYIRKMNSKFGNDFTRFILKMPYKDCTSGFKLINSKVLDTNFVRKINSNGYLFQVEILYYFYKKNLKIKEIPINFTDRIKGKSKLSVNDILEYFTKINKIKNKYKDV